MAPTAHAAAGAAAAARNDAANADDIERHCARLRSLVQDCIAKHLYGSAVFHADKLLVLSSGAPADVYLLAQAMYVARQPLRALALLKAPPTLRRSMQQHPMHPLQAAAPRPPPPPHEAPSSPLLSDARFAYLAAKCAAAAGEWHEALVLLGSEDGAEAELEALERAWAPALAAAAARAAAAAGGDPGEGEGMMDAGAATAAAATAGDARGGAGNRGRSSAGGGGGAAAVAGGGGGRRSAGGASGAAAPSQARRRSSAGGAQQQQQQPLHPQPIAAAAELELPLPPGAAPASGTEVALSSAVCLLRGQGYLALDDRARAARWLRAALLRDPFCEDAFSLLADGALLPAPAEVELVLALPLRPEDEWLRLMYRARCKQYGPGQERGLDAVLDELERPYAPQGRPASTEQQRGEGEEGAAAAAAMPSSPPPPAPAGAGAGGGGRQSARQRRSSAGGAQQQQQQQSAFASPPPPSAAAAPPLQPLPLMTPATAEEMVTSSAFSPPPPPTIAVPPTAARSVGAKRTQAKQVKQAALGGPLRDVGGGAPPQATAAAAGSHHHPLRGWGLGGCSVVLACRAARLLHLGRYTECLALTTDVLARDPRADGALLPPHLAAALALGRKDELFLR
jgi:uncharacterized membrane protein YgcG